jgi:alpha-L-arabinofuranosidase
MLRFRLQLAWALMMAAMVATGSLAAPALVTVDVSHPRHRLPRTLLGIFFEDINLSADGGLYPELVRNRSFEDGDQPRYWRLLGTNDLSGKMAVEGAKPMNPFNPKYLRVEVGAGVVIENEGYWGMSVAAGESYVLKLAALAQDGLAGPLVACLVSESGKELARGAISELSGDWKYHSLVLTPVESDAHARLQLAVGGRGRLLLDMVSLLPEKTWKGGGLRVDLAESLDALAPSFLRFPGGCWVEGDDRQHMYHWKNTIGELDARPALYNLWDYRATHGLGFHEYLLMAENLGAEPLFVINCGMSHKDVVPMGEMALWVRDALDAIEYANGPTNSYWGGLRARAGHPAPFGLRYLEIGNENGGPAYRERWPLFVKAIRQEHPEIQLVANHWQGGYPADPPPDLVDEHYYDTPEFFMAQAAKYDSYSRTGPKVFVGEYAVTRNCGLGNLRGAIGEAAFMTGLERNSDVVAMACYAPLFANVNHRRWAPDLINFDGSRWYGTPSYYVQQLFSHNRGDLVLPVTVQCGKAAASAAVVRAGLGTWNTVAEFKDVKIASGEAATLLAPDFSSDTNGWEFLGPGRWTFADGVLRQNVEGEFVRAIAQKAVGTNYVLSLKARKISGREGFLILFQNTDAEDRNWWNIGGWNNTRDGVEWGQVLDSKAGGVETGRWYDIQVRVDGDHVVCRMDGEVVHDLRLPRWASWELYASATLDERTGETIVKVVNTSATGVESQIQLTGVSKVEGPVRAEILTSASGRDENTLEEPARVFPRVISLEAHNQGTRWTFPGNSLTILRFKGTR